MPLILFIILIVVLESAAPGLVAQLAQPFLGLIGSPLFFAAFAGTSLSASFWMSIGQTSLASRRRDAAIEKAEAEYRQEKGWL